VTFAANNAYSSGPLGYRAGLKKIKSKNCADKTKKTNKELGRDVGLLGVALLSGVPHLTNSRNLECG